MKRIQHIFWMGAVLLLSACSKPEAVLFNDQSTAVKADRNGWTATASSEELSGEGSVNGRAAVLLDGNISTFWHSQWAGATPPYPHWVVVDMKKPLKLIVVDLTARQNNANGMTKFTLEGSTDGTNWVNLKSDGGNYTFDPAVKSAQSFPVTATPVQYIRVNMLEGKSTSTHLAEFEAFSAK